MIDQPKIADAGTMTLNEVRLGPHEGDCRTCTAYMYGGCIDNNDPGWPTCKFKRTTEFLAKRIWTQTNGKWHCTGYEMLEPNQCHECGGVMRAIAYTKHDALHLGHATFACPMGHEHYYGIVKIWMRKTREQQLDDESFGPARTSDVEHVIHITDEDVANI